MKNTFITAKDFNEARKKIRASKANKIIFSSPNDDLNRKILEKENIDTLLIPLEERRDFQKQRNSGFNHVLAKEAKKKKTTIGIDIDEIIKSANKSQKAKILSRIMQNVKLCNKNKLNMSFISVSGKYDKDLKDLKSLGSILGMPTWMLK